MKYMVTWSERPMGSALEYEAAQKRILGVFQRWQAPASLRIEQFLVRVGEYGGYMLVETQDAAALQKLSSTFPAFTFRVEPVLDIQTAVQAELEAIAWRDGLPS
jgi:muconolactone delta-isomerase